MEDISLEEGLLTNQEDADHEANDKGELQAVTVSTSKIPERDRDDDKGVAL
jgi:hypothetical protein